MSVAQYEIVPMGKSWSIQHDGKTSGEYATKEAAFEAAAIVASMAIHKGYEVHVRVPSAEDSGAASKAI